MDMNQEHYVIPWWSSEPPYRMEILIQGVQLTILIDEKRGEDVNTRLFKEVYTTIIKNEGHIFVEDHGFVRSCRELGVNRLELDETMRKLLEELNSTISTTKATEILWLPPRKIRQLIADGVLKATKKNGKWSLNQIDVIRLAARKLGFRT